MSDRAILVFEYRHAANADGPWNEPEPDVSIGTQRECDWQPPYRIHISDPARQYQQHRVVPYVPESELERYRKVVACFLANMLRDRCPSCVVSRWRHQPDCLLVANGFIDREGRPL